MSTESTNNLTLAESERLYILMEECAEVTKECAKILRFGYTAVDATKGPPVCYDNRAILTTEIGDLQGALMLLYGARDIEWNQVCDARDVKLEKLERYTKHQS